MGSTGEKKPREYRLDVRLPPEVSQELEKLVNECKKKTGRSVSKSEVVVNILRSWFTMATDHKSIL
jgi:Arc/MetJ-type ribon-helix-helix transcriptional regulator